MSKTLPDLLSDLRYDSFSNRISEIDPNSPNRKEEFKKVLDEYVNYVLDYLKDKPIEIVVASLDIFNNYNPQLSSALMKNPSDNIYRAMLVIEKLNGTNVLDIKNNLKEAITYNDLIIMSNGSGFSKDNNVRSELNKFRLTMLNDYLKGKSDDEVEALVNGDLERFANGLNNIDEALFSLSNKSSIPPRSNIINNIFLNENISDDILDKIYNEVLLKNQYLRSFDYTTMIVESGDIIARIKGLYRKCGPKFFEFFSDVELDDELKEEFDEFFNGIIELNKDDEDGLKWFFRELGKRSKDNKELDEYLKSKDYYNKYLDNNDNLYKDAVVKLLNDEYDIDENLLEELGTSKAFLDNYELFVDKFMTSDDKEYQNKLMIPLVRGLVEKQKEKYNLKFQTIFTTDMINNTNLGHYNKANKELYINPMYMECFDNKKAAFALAIETVYHETRHAYQEQVLKESDELSYDNLVMAMDSILSETAYSSYYKDNYKHVSFERDARDSAYVDTMTYFDKYKDVQKMIVPDNEADYVLSDYVRKDSIAGYDKYVGVIQLFMDYVNDMIDVCHGDKETIDYFLNKYKVIGQFFEISKESGYLVPRSEEYFENRRKELEQMPDSIEKKEGLYSIKAFEYSKKVTNYLYKNDKEKDKNEKDYNKKIIGEVLENVGPKPRR